MDGPKTDVAWYWSLDAGLSGPETVTLLALLRGLQATGTLRPAAVQAGISYRKAWGLLQRAERGLGQALVRKARGRGTGLTPWANELLSLDQSARDALAVVHAPWAARLAELRYPAGNPMPARLRLIASHDVALADWIEHGRDVIVDLEWRGSELAIEALLRGDCDVAGFHLPGFWSASQVLTWGQRWFSGRNLRCALLMRRSQGLLTAPGNPFGLTSLADVARLGLRLVNRQRGSGTRSMIDALIVANGLRPDALTGYAHEEFTHDAVAAAIACGQADAGVGLEAVARRYDLGYVPLGWDRYCLVARPNQVASAAMQQLRRRLSGQTFLQRLVALGGYRRCLPEAPFMPWEALLAQPEFC